MFPDILPHLLLQDIHEIGRADDFTEEKNQGQRAKGLTLGIQCVSGKVET